ncbi:NAD-dependent epimerase/dehydratase family protein [Listeria booriae]|uniref:NAD-dependent epimerase/dehydratase family protein n=1 Tax=Listeria booriae TaxID=1552123 RepID=UPI0016277B0F|nr:NAD-dependent epimerase/dehydratase family protein [Listeria booriae]
MPQCISPYAITKYASEKYLDIYANTYGFEYTVLRDATIFESRQTLRRAVPITWTKKQ